MPDASVAVDHEGRIAASNSALRSLLGYEADELAGQPVEILVPETLHAGHESHRRAFDGRPERREMATSRQLAARHRDGHLIDVLISLLPVSTGAGRHVVAALFDITALRRTEAALRESEDRYRDLVENSLELMCTQDLEGNLLSVNEAALALTGYAREALLRMNVADLLAPDVRDRFRDYSRELRAEGRARGLMKVRTASGETRFWEFSNSVRTDGVSAPIVRGMARDVTEAFRAKKALRESEGKYRALIEQMGEGLVLVDESDIVRFVNPRICRMLGYAESELVGRHAATLLLREEDRAAMAERNLRRSRGVAEGYEIELRRKSGEFVWTRFAATPLESADGGMTGSLAIIADVSERKRNEALSAGQRRVLEMIAGGTQLDETLTELLRVVEAQAPEMLTSVLLLDRDGRHLRHGAAPSLPDEYLQAIDGLTVGPAAGSCGTAAYRREPVIVEDIAVDPLWQHGRELALHHGLRACWSTPILDAKREVLGTFAIYYREPGRPTARQLQLIDVATHTAAIAISRERTEAVLRRSEVQLRSFVEHAPVDIAMFDNEMVCLAASRRWIDRYRRALSTPVGLRHYEVNPDLPERWKEVHRRALAGESSSSDEDVWVRSDGTRQWLRWSVDPWRDPKGAIGGLVIFLEDISARREAQEAILAEKAFSESILDALPGILFLFEEGGRFLRWNRALEAVSGYSAEEIAALHPLDLVAEDERDGFGVAIESAFESGTASLEANLIGSDGGRTPYFFTAARSVVGGALCCLVTATDLTARKQLEAELQQAQKLEAIGRLAGGVAHDFNNILGVILGYGELAESELEPGSPAREQVAEMITAAERAAALTRQLRAFSRKQILQPERLDLNQLVASAQKILNRLIGADITLVFRPASDLAAVRADPSQIDQVLLNLAVNARDAMSAGGVLTLETANVELDEEFVARHRPMSPGPYVLLAVSDTGAGMSAETRRQIFEPFFTTKPVDQGTGLGLATVYGIIKQSGGYIWVDSEPGLGTTFKIYLPQAHLELDSAAPVRVAAVVPGGRETILLVEDNRALRESLRLKLEALGYTVLLAADGEEALAVAAARAESIDLLLTDVVMPRLGGAELAPRLSALRPGIRVLFMSGYTNGAIADQGELPEGVVLLEKPFSGARLMRAVREALDRPPRSG